MKKLFYAFAALALLVSASSCKKCGYCKYPAGYNSDSVCNQTGVLASVDNSYDEAKSQCSADQGTWVTTK